MPRVSQSEFTTNDPAKLKEILDKYGVAILKNYFKKNYANKLFNATIKWLEKLDIGLSFDPKTWTSQNTPSGPMYGMYQNIISHCPAFWKLREQMYKLFVLLLDEEELLTSIDGASIYPGINAPAKYKDWAHIDQTVSSKLMCYQSQFVTTNTTAAFVATIGSHLKHGQVLKLCNIKDKSSNWHKFTDKEVLELEKIFRKNYQVPIEVSRGSIIFWDSRTIHSAKYPDDNSWRGVFYVSMRPVDNFSQKDIDTLTRAAIEGRTTNHWGTKIFPISNRRKAKNNRIVNLSKDLSQISFVPEMNDLQKRLIGLLDY